MRFSIVGAGALGTILAAHLLEAGHEVRLVARGARAEYLSKNGLRVYGLREFALPCPPVAALEAGIDDDVVVYAVKTYHMEAALAPAGDITPKAVFSLANGVMKNDQLVSRFGASSVLGCMANFSGELNSDGTVSFTRNICLHLGGENAYARDVVNAIHQAGIISAHSDAIESVEWSKYVGWLAFFALSVISRTTTGLFMSDDHFAAVAARAVREAASIAKARGIPLVDQSPMPVKSVSELPFEQSVEKIQAVGAEFHASAPNHRLSALQDLEAGRALEVHETLGYAVTQAKRLGVPAATLETLYQLSAGLNAIRR